MHRAVKKLSSAEFLAMSVSSDRTELVDGEIIPKVSSKYQHSTLQLRLLGLHQWCENHQAGRVRPEWAAVLQRSGQDWVPVPDLTYVSYKRLPADWDEDKSCPVLPELVGVSRVWVADNQAQSVTVFGANEFPQTYWVGDTISDALLPGLAIPVADLFAKRGRSPDANENQ